MSRIMVQGTTSSAGKSMLTLALCRIFYNMGYKVAPFKSQNMSRNSYALKNGKIMSTAQTIQAIGAKVEPAVEMNPILLVPSTDTGSDVYFNGEYLQSMQAREYFKYKTKLIPKIEQIYKNLESNNDIVIIEGAGSPAEINLKQNDLVNMGMAKIASSDVILVADIDRGGVFASLYGTVALLDEDEKSRIKGFVINKFRGDESLLQSGIETIEKLTNIPVIGVIPFVHLEIPDEDSLVEYEKKCNSDLLNFEELDSEINKLSEIVSKHLDLNKICEIIGVENRNVN